MSTPFNNPQYPPAQQPAAEGAARYAPNGQQPTSSAKPNGWWWAGAVAVALVLAVGGFFLGKSREAASYDPGSSGYEQIFQAGYAEGQMSGKKAGKKEGVSEGEQAGYQDGYDAGKKAGIKQGKRAGMSEGATMALGTTSGWSPQANYVVKVESGTDVPWMIADRSEMETGLNYYLCENSEGKVCDSPRSEGN